MRVLFRLLRNLGASSGCGMARDGPGAAKNAVVAEREAKPVCDSINGTLWSAVCDCPCFGALVLQDTRMLCAWLLCPCRMDRVSCHVVPWPEGKRCANGWGFRAADRSHDAGVGVTGGRAVAMPALPVFLGQHPEDRPAVSRFPIPTHESRRRRLHSIGTGRSQVHFTKQEDHHGRRDKTVATRH